MLKLKDRKSLSIPRHHILERDLKIVENLAVEEDIVAHLEAVGVQMIMDKGVGGTEIQVNLSLLFLHSDGYVVRNLRLTQSIGHSITRERNLESAIWTSMSTIFHMEKNLRLELYSEESQDIMPACVRLQFFLNYEQDLKSEQSNSLV